MAEFPSAAYFDEMVSGLGTCTLYELQYRLAQVQRYWSSSHMIEQYADSLRKAQYAACSQIQSAIEAYDPPVVTNPERSIPMDASLPVIEDLSFAALQSERTQLEAGIKDASSLTGVAKQVALGAISARHERVTWAIQAFEKVTWRQLKLCGVKT